MKKLITALTLVFALGATLLAEEKYQLSTHVLDTTLGKPGEGVDVTNNSKTGSYSFEIES